MLNNVLKVFQLESSRALSDSTQGVAESVQSDFKDENALGLLALVLREEQTGDVSERHIKST